MNGHEASLPIRGQRQVASAQPKEVPQAVVKDLNRVTGVKFSKATWGVIWVVITGAGGWITSMKFDSVNQGAALNSMKDTVTSIAASVAEMKKETKDGIDKMDGKLERFGERLTRVEIEAGTHAKD